MKNICFVLLAFLLWGCSSNYYYTISYSRMDLFKNAPVISIDSSYNYYIRKVFKSDKSSNEKKFVSNYYTAGLQQDLIEIEYLLVSKNTGNIIYLTMLQDRRQQYYARNYIGDQYINAHDFKNFLFGAAKVPAVVFTSKKDITTTDEWYLKYNNSKDTVWVESIIENIHGEYEQSIPVERALDKRIGFSKISPPALVFYDPYDDVHKILSSADNKIHIYKPYNKDRIHFIFRDNEQDWMIYFKDNRMPYRPDPFFEH
jgi:hypothetical protein